MARDRELFEAAESGVVGARVYSWDGPWVSLGKSQQPQRALVDQCPVPWVSRPTGGKAVLHGHDVTLGLALPLTALGLEPGRRSVAEVYRPVVKLIVSALQDCGVAVALGEETRFVADHGPTADCFAHVAPNDVVRPDTGQKVCGCALRMSQTAVLVQASIPAGRPLVDPATVFNTPAPVSWVALEAAQFAGALEELLRRTAPSGVPVS